MNMAGNRSSGCGSAIKWMVQQQRSEPLSGEKESTGRLKSSDNLDEAAATTLGVDFLEALLFLSLLDNTDRRYEETQNDGHETINGRKRVLKGVVREGRNARNTKVRCDCGVEALRKSRVLAKAAANRGVGRGKVAAAAELILESGLVSEGQRGPFLLELVALAQGEEPDHGADGGDEASVDNEEPVEDDEANGDMIPLHDCSEGH